MGSLDEIFPLSKGGKKAKREVLEDFMRSRSLQGVVERLTQRRTDNPRRARDRRQLRGSPL